MTDRIGNLESVPLSEGINSKLHFINHKFSKIQKMFSNDLTPKEIQFGTETFKDNEQRIYVPIMDNGKVPPSYHGVYREDQSKYLAVVSKGHDGQRARVEIHKKDYSAQIGTKTLILSSDIVAPNDSIPDQYAMRSHNGATSLHDGLAYLQTLGAYLDSYMLPDPKEEAELREEQIEQIKVQEILADETDMSPDDILEKLRAE